MPILAQTAESKTPPSATRRPVRPLAPAALPAPAPRSRPLRASARPERERCAGPAGSRRVEASPAGSSRGAGRVPRAPGRPPRQSPGWARPGHTHSWGTASAAGPARPAPVREEATVAPPRAVAAGAAEAAAAAGAAPVSASARRAPARVRPATLQVAWSERELSAPEAQAPGQEPERVPVRARAREPDRLEWARPEEAPRERVWASRAARARLRSAAAWARPAPDGQAAAARGGAHGHEERWRPGGR